MSPLKTTGSHLCESLLAVAVTFVVWWNDFCSHWGWRFISLYLKHRKRCFMGSLLFLFPSVFFSGQQTQCFCLPPFWMGHWVIIPGEVNLDTSSSQNHARQLDRLFQPLREFQGAFNSHSLNGLEVFRTYAKCVGFEMQNPPPQKKEGFSKIGEDLFLKNCSPKHISWNTNRNRCSPPIRSFDRSFRVIHLWSRSKLLGLNVKGKIFDFKGSFNARSQSMQVEQPMPFTNNLQSNNSRVSLIDSFPLHAFLTLIAAPFFLNP